ncbi:MAG: ATP-binding protein [Erysipelotrichaceae bacterium]|nr:ATP-binding protein [Erysipelotrichaceae bacterium]
MGTYLNPDNMDFQELRNSKICVDKSMLIEYTNSIIRTKDKFVCVSRPRRFGKSTDANMLVAYYSKEFPSNNLFDDLKISKVDSYQKHLNQYNVISLDMLDFYSEYQNAKEMKAYITKILMFEIKQAFPDVFFYDDSNLSMSLQNVYNQTGEQFIYIIDEWDCILRDTNASDENKKDFLEFLRTLFKTKSYIALVYMTGILPIKKYGDESALNMFKEITMVNAVPLEKFMGFTEDEVKCLCEENNMNFNEMKSWYDGYHIGNYSIYSPRSIVSAINDQQYENYWTETGTFESLKDYICMNFDGLKETIVSLLAGNEIEINASKFKNDVTTFKSKDDVLTLLVHLGYLSYNKSTKTVYIPNKEVTDSFINAIEDSDWDETIKAIKNSKQLLENTWDMNEEKVAKGLEEVHDSFINSNLKYNDENSLYTTIMMAFFTARNYYMPFRELPSGKGFCDITFIPYKPNYPAMIVELKYDKDVETAIDQIKERKYTQNLEHYHGNLLLLGISYNKGEKKHIAKIEKFVKD